MSFSLFCAGVPRLEKGLISTPCLLKRAYSSTHLYEKGRIITTEGVVVRLPSPVCLIRPV